MLGRSDCASVLQQNLDEETARPPNLCEEAREQGLPVPSGQPFVLETTHEMTILRTFAACTTILAVAMVAAHHRCRLRNLHRLRLPAWMADGWFESKSSLVIQNVILLFINILGVWRWLPRAEG